MLRRSRDVVEDASNTRHRVNVYPNIEVTGPGRTHIGDVVFPTQPLIDAQQHAQDAAELRAKEQLLIECHRCFKTSDYEHGKNINPKRAEGTCRWVTGHELFQTWLKESSQSPL